LLVPQVKNIELARRADSIFFLSLIVFPSLSAPRGGADRAAIGTARLQKQQGFCQQDQDITRILICQEYFNKILVKID